MTDAAIILDNQGDNTYAQNAREFLTSPIVASRVRIILSTANQLNNILMIRHDRSEGGNYAKDISIRNYVNAKNATNLIIDVPLDPPLVLDGKTYFQTDVEPNSEIDLLFYFDQLDRESLLE
jgi:hypothetical protein